MQIKRIHVGKFYQTKQSVGKCLSTAGKHLKFQIDGKDGWLSSSEIQHEIANGQEPKQDAPAHAGVIPAYIAHLEAVNSEMRDALEDTLVHVEELREAWRTGAIREGGHPGAIRSNRNADLENKVRMVLKKANGKS